MIIESLWGKIVLITDVWGKIGQGGANALRATDAIVYGVEIPFRISRLTHPWRLQRIKGIKG